MNSNISFEITSIINNIEKLDYKKYWLALIEVHYWRVEYIIDGFGIKLKIQAKTSFFIIL